MLEMPRLADRWHELGMMISEKGVGEGDKICKKGQSSRKRLHRKVKQEERKKGKAKKVEGKKAPCVRIGGSSDLIYCSYLL